MRQRERLGEREGGLVLSEREKERETETERLRQRDSERETETERDRDRKRMNERTLFHESNGLDSGSFYIQPSPIKD